MNREVKLSAKFSVLICLSVIFCPILSLLFTDYSLYFLGFQLVVFFSAIARFMYLTLKIRKLEREYEKLKKDREKSVERFEEIFGVDIKDVLK